MSATQSGQPDTDIYDRYGNRWKQLYNGACMVGSTFCATFDGNNHNNNALLVYDAAGNVTMDNMHHYGYDGRSPGGLPFSPPSTRTMRRESE